MINWNSSLASKANELNNQIQQQNPDILHNILARQSLQQFTEIASGIERFNRLRYEHNESHNITSWQDGSSKLLDYGLENNSQHIMLFVPSLINRAYIFDISPENSMLKFYQEQNIACALMDWGSPEIAEQEFSLQDYIQRLQNAIEYLSDKYHKKIVLVGYCMGGLLSLAAACLDGRNIAALTFLGTPWDFNSPDVKKYQWNQQSIESFNKILEMGDFVAGELVYYLMYLQNPWAVHQKYMRFAKMDINSKQAQEFIQREIWVNDAVPLAKKAGKEIFIDWGIDNLTAQQQWKVKNQLINPQNITTPTFVAMASNDMIVPQLCASALINNLQNPHCVIIQSAHVGMIIGKNAKQNLWIPLANWVNNL